MARKAMLVDLKRCAGCGACVVACQMQHNARPGMAWNVLSHCEWGEYPDAKRCYLPHACMHCDEPPCVSVCTTGASYKTDDGIVLVDYDICLGCGECVEACPYAARHIGTNDSYFFNSSQPAPYEEYGTQRINVAEKCTFCYELIQEGMLPSCLTNCPGKARFFGDIDDPESEVAQKSKDAMRVGTTGFYYLRPEGMPSDLIVAKVMPTGESDDDTGTSGDKKSEDKDSNLTPILIGAGAAVVVAAGAGAGYVINKKNKAKKAEAGDSNEK